MPYCYKSSSIYPTKGVVVTDNTGRLWLAARPGWFLVSWDKDPAPSAGEAVLAMQKIGGMQELTVVSCAWEACIVTPSRAIVEDQAKLLQFIGAITALFSLPISYRFGSSEIDQETFLAHIQECLTR